MRLDIRKKYHMDSKDTNYLRQVKIDAAKKICATKSSKRLKVVSYATPLMYLYQMQQPLDDRGSETLHQIFQQLAHQQGAFGSISYQLASRLKFWFANVRVTVFLRT